jgi:hypothetical protein
MGLGLAKRRLQRHLVYVEQWHLPDNDASRIGLGSQLSCFSSVRVLVLTRRIQVCRMVFPDCVGIRTAVGAVSQMLDGRVEGRRRGRPLFWTLEWASGRP